MAEEKLLVFSLDLEVELTQWKIGLEIFDLAIICREDPKYNFESTKCFVLEEERLMTFSEYAPIMINRLKEACDQIPHDKVVFLAHNGFPHDYLIIFDCLERAGLLDRFRSEFEGAAFLDSLSFFKAYQKLHKGQFSNDDGSVSLGLESLCGHFCNYSYKAHTAAVDAESLLVLMDHKPTGAGGNTFLQLNLHKDYSAHNKSVPEVTELFENRKKLESIRHIPGYGARYKQLEVALSEEKISSDVVHALLDNGYGYFQLKKMGVKTKKEIEAELTPFCSVKSQIGRIAAWCRKIAGVTEEPVEDPEKKEEPKKKRGRPRKTPIILTDDEQKLEESPAPEQATDVITEDVSSEMSKEENL